MAIVTGTNGSNFLRGTNESDEIYGLDGNDVLIGLGGINFLYGGRGNDIYYVTSEVGSTVDVVFELPGEGYDTVFSSAGSYTLTPNVEALTLVEAAGAATGIGNDGANLLVGNRYDNVLDGGLGADTMIGGRGNDLYRVESTGDRVIEERNEGIDTVESSIAYVLGANVENLTLIGSAAVNATGNDLDNVLQGNSALNALTGGRGNDTYVMERGAPIGLETSFEAFGEPGAFVIEGPHKFTPADGTIFANVNDWTGDGEPDGIDFGFQAPGTFYMVRFSASTLGMNLTPGVYEDARNFENGHPALFFFGFSAPGTIFGEFTIIDLEFDSSAGFPQLASFYARFEQHSETPGAPGEFGSVKYNWTDQFETDTIVELPNQGIDTVRSAINYTLGANLENLVLTGSATNGTGNAAANELTGNARNNLLDGAAGADTMVGGAGDDTYIVDNKNDVVVEKPGEGEDAVFASVSYTLSANIETLILGGSAAIDGTGNAGANTIRGNAAANTLRGGDGNDTLDGADGADHMEGGRGDDTYIVGSVGDEVRELGNQGIDSVLSAISYTLGAHVENLTLLAAGVSGTGNDLDNVITGNAAANTLTGGDGNDVLDGREGADTMKGGKGDDTYHVDNAADIVSEAGGGGTDTVVSAIAFTLAGDFENLTLTGFLDINGTGNARNNVIVGNFGANKLMGGDGNDVLDGGQGFDDLRGGKGNDVYVVDELADKVTEAANEGTDLVRSSSSFTLSANVENLTLTGLADATGIGNALANTIVGNAGNNVLDGAGGADRMTGGAGNDTYVVDNAGDAVTESANEGIDTVRSSITYTLGANLENLTLTGIAAINGTGNSLDNVLIGNSAANVLKGGKGNDTYQIGGLDTVVENANEGTDTVVSSVTHTLGANFENLTLTGTAPIDGTGNARDNILIGNNGNNTLTGGDGNDRLEGRGGADTLRGGAGNDTYVIDDVVDASNAATRVKLVGSAGEYVFSDTRLVTAADGGFYVDFPFDATRDVIPDSVGVRWEGNNGFERVTLTLATYAMDANLEPGFYADARRSPDPGQPQLDLSVDFRGSNQVFGNFTIHEIVFDYGTPEASLLRLSADFEYHGESPLAAPIFGEWRYNASVGSAVTDAVVENANQGTDTVLSSVDFTLPANVENLVLTGAGSIRGTGNALANVITGNAGNNWLDGGAGSDTMRGGAGDDVYIVANAGDQVEENADGGYDRVLSSITYTLGANVENLILTGNAAINGIGNELNNGLTGNAAANVLTGGAGDDIYVVGSNDTIVEKPGEGTDTARALESYTLAPNVENLTLVGSADINGTGNALDNFITGNSGDNVLAGGAGTDFLRGLAGDDTYLVNEFEIILEEQGHGADLVVSTISYTLPTEVENLTLTGAGNLNGAGNELANVITGNSGNNELGGAQGLDTLIGGAGDDTYYVDGTSGDTTATLSFFGEPGTNFEGPHLFTMADGQFFVNLGDQDSNGIADTLSVNYYDFPENFFSLTVTTALIPSDLAVGFYPDARRAFFELGHPGLDFSGNGAGSNQVFGEFTVNALSYYRDDATVLRPLDVSFDFEQHSEDPGAPAVTGSFTYHTTILPDTVVEQANQGHDTVVSTVTYTLGDHLENLRLAGTQAIDGTGNAAANVISGNAASNHLTGGGGADTFLYTEPSAADSISDFTLGAAGDKLDVSAVIDYVGGAPNLASFVQLAANGAHTDVRVDSDGVGGDFMTLVTLENIAATPGLLNAMVAQGNLIVA